MNKSEGKTSIGETNRVIHVDGKELYRDSLRPDIAGSHDIIGQLESFLETRMVNKLAPPPAGLKKWKLFSGTETIPEKEVSLIALNIQSLTGPVHVLSFPDTLKGNLIYSPDMSELHRQLFRSLKAAIEDGISTFEKSSGVFHPQREAPE